MTLLHYAGSILKEQEEHYQVSGGTFSVFISHCKWDETDQKVSVPWKTAKVEDVGNFQDDTNQAKCLVLNAAIHKLKNPCHLPIAHQSQSQVAQGRKRKRGKRETKCLTGLKPLPSKRLTRVRGTTHVLVQVRNVEWITLHDWVRSSTYVPVIVPPTCLFDKSAGHLKATLDESAKTLGVSELGSSANLRIFLYECDNAKQNVAILKDKAQALLKGLLLDRFSICFFLGDPRVLKF